MPHSSLLWRGSFVLGGLLVCVGGPMHPGGTMAQMLADPMWLTSHAIMTVGFAFLAIGWWMLTRAAPPDRRRWYVVAAVATAVQALDMVFHTFAYVDAEAYVAGGATPVFSTHMFLAPVINPLYGLAMILVIWHFQRGPGPGSVIYGWIGMAGALAHAIANLGVAGFGIEGLRFLFPFVVLLALWHVIVGVVPEGRREDPAARPGPPRPAGSSARRDHES